MPFLIKLKTILLSKKCFFIIITFLYCLIFLNIPYNSKYASSEKEFYGVITNIKVDENKIELLLRSKENLLVNYYFDDSNQINLNLGDYVKIIGSLTEPSNNSNFNLFNYKKYLYSKKIYHIVSAESIQILKNNKNLFFIIKNKIIDKIEEMDNRAYVKAFLLGDTSEIDPNIRKSYQVNGVSHLFAVSGMHISFISGILYFFMRKANGILKHIIVISFLIFFAFLVNYSPSVMRSILLVLFSLINKKLNLKIKPFDIFLTLTCLFLIYNPYLIYNSGFLYSFVISGFLIYYKEKIQSKNYILGVLKVSYITFLASFPITIWNFFELNILSILFNVFFVPLVAFIVFPVSLLSLIFTFLVPIHMLFINILESISLYCSQITILTFIFAKPHIIVVLFYYVIVILMLHDKKYIIFFILSLFVHFNINRFNNYPVLTFLDVGQGDSLLLELSKNKGNILIDTGGSYNNSNHYISSNTIIPYLKSKGVKQLDYLIITHGDYDHMGESINLVNNFKVEKVIFNCGEYNDLEKELIKVLDKKKIPYYSCIKELNIDDNKLYFLNNKDYGNENDNSSVIYTELNKYKFLFMGDAGVEVEEDLIEKYNLDDIDILKVGHHGSKTSSSKTFIGEVNPTYSIISVGKNNRYGHPNDSVLETLENSIIYRTDQDGSVMFNIKNNKLQMETCSP